MPREKVTFPGHGGQSLAALYDKPDGPPRANVLFAHCFTCSKDIYAATRISSELTKLGYGVLRFDFTGIGASEGEFANTNFSSNVQDLVAAADDMRENGRAPSVLVGHSLGGAAVLSAAKHIPEAKAVATIAAPSSAEHVLHNFHAHVEQIERDGEAAVTLAGRAFTIKKSFLDDVRAQTLTEDARNLKRALLVFHAPLDETVGISNATEIFVAARHPKSFVSLEGADHLLSRKSDAVYVARVLAAWAERYMDVENATGNADVSRSTSAATSGEPAPGDGAVRVRETRANPFQQQITVGRHTLMADEPTSYGGGDTGPSPYDLVAAGLGACTAMTVRMYAERRKLPVERVDVTVRHDKVHVTDCEGCADGETRRIDRFQREVAFSGALDEATRAKLLEIADKCPVHRTLEAGALIETRERNDDSGPGEG